MGLFDQYAETRVDDDEDNYVQIKVNHGFDTYYTGDPCPLPDGVFIGYEGVVCVRNGKVLMVSNHVYDKWGGIVDLTVLLHDNSPIVAAIKRATEQ